jgi:hypothetical protein
MKNCKKIFIMTILVCFLNSCTGYTPIFSEKNINFKIEKIEKKGDQKIGNFLVENLNINQSNADNIEKISLSIYTTKNKTSVIKDKSGKIVSYKLQINIRAIVKIISSNKIIVNENFKGTSNFDNKNQTYETIKLENKITKDLVKKLTTDLILRINQSL